MEDSSNTKSDKLALDVNDVKSAAHFANELRIKLESRERELEAATARIQGLEKLTVALGARKVLYPNGTPSISFDYNSTSIPSSMGPLSSPAGFNIAAATGLSSIQQTQYSNNPFLSGWPVSLMPTNNGGGSFSVTPLQLSDSNTATGLTPALSPDILRGQLSPTKSSFSGMFSIPSSVPTTISEHTPLSGAAKYSIPDIRIQNNHQGIHRPSTTPFGGTQTLSTSSSSSSHHSNTIPPRYTNTTSAPPSINASSTKPVDLLEMISQNRETRNRELQQGEYEATKRLNEEIAANNAIEQERINRRSGKSQRKPVSNSMPSTPSSSSSSSSTHFPLSNTTISNFSSSASSSSSSSSSFNATVSNHTRHAATIVQSSNSNSRALSTEHPHPPPPSSSSSSSHSVPTKRTPLVVHPEGGVRVAGVGHFAPKASFSSSANSNTFAKLSAAMLSQAYVSLPTHSNINIHTSDISNTEHTSYAAASSSSSSTISSQAHGHGHIAPPLSSSSSTNSNGTIVKHGFSGSHISPTIAPHLTFGASPYLRYTTTSTSSAATSPRGGGGGRVSPQSKGSRLNHQNISSRPGTAPISANTSPSGKHGFQNNMQFIDPTNISDTTVGVNQTVLGPAAMRRLEATKKAADFVDKYRNRSSSASSISMSETTPSAPLVEPDGQPTRFIEGDRDLTTSVSNLIENTLPINIPTFFSSSGSVTNNAQILIEQDVKDEGAPILSVSFTTSVPSVSTNEIKQYRSSSPSKQKVIVNTLSNTNSSPVSSGRPLSTLLGKPNEPVEPKEPLEPLKVFDAQVNEFASMMHFNLLGPQLQSSSWRPNR